jgi:RNA polymerase sigma-70 factor (ECF subfamily)
VAIAQRVVADRAEAEDVAQEVFLDFHHRHPPDAPYAPAWLYRAAAHTALNRIRSRKRRQRRELASAALDPTARSSRTPTTSSRRSRTAVSSGRRWAGCRRRRPRCSRSATAA